MTVARLERVAIVLTPVLAITTVAIGLRLGESSRVMGARVKVASLGSGRSGVWLQLTTLAEEGGVPELVQLPGLTVVGRTRGAEARWSGGSNSEGVAEAWLAFPRVSPSDVVTLSVTSADGVDLGQGVIDLPAAPSQTVGDHAEVRATRTDGRLALEVSVYGSNLIPAASTRVVVHVRDAVTGQGVDGARIAVDAEPGLTIEHSFAATSGGGWSEAIVQADFLMAAWTLTATGPVAETGTWYGALPISPGAATANLPLRIDARAPYTLRLVAPPATKRLYVEVDDAQGRDFGAALDVTPGPRGGVADVEIPPVAPGLYWLITSSDPHGAETLTGSSLARPFRVGATHDASLAELAALARMVPPKTTSVIVLDGLAAPHRLASTAEKRGILMGLIALALATVLEVLLVLRAASRTRQKLLAMTEAMRDEGELAEGGSAGGAGGVLVLVLITLLGFALLAALLIVSGR